MAILIDFPTQQVRDWKMFAQALGEMLERCEVPPELHERFIDRMRPLFDSYVNRPLQLQFTIPWETLPAIPESLRQAFERTLVASISSDLEAKVRSLVGKMFDELFDREVRLCFYDFGLEAPEADS